MQAIWKGSITWGLVSVPVTLHSANQDQRASLKLHQIHRPDGSRIRYHRFCEAEDVEVPNDEIVKGVDIDDETIVITKADMDKLPLPSRSSIEVSQFVPASHIDMLAVHDSYYLAPQQPTRPYSLLAESLAEADVVAVAKVAIRDRERLSMVRSRDGLLLLHTLYWPEEIRRPDFATPGDSDRISKQERKMASQLIASMTVDEPEWSEFHDEYTTALRELIERKAKGKGVKAPRSAGGGGQVIDLMEALEKSISGGKKSAKKTTKKAAKKSTAKRSKKTA